MQMFQAVVGMFLPWHFFMLFTEILAAEDEDVAKDPDPDNVTELYTMPNVAGIHWVETFDGDVWSRWTASDGEKYNGKFTASKRNRESLVGDVGFLIPDEAKHYGAFTTFSKLEGKKGVPFAIQYEVGFQDGLSCGGAYLKLFNNNGKKAGEFKDDTPYTIMFGPDKCGATDKVHFILQHVNPKTGKSEEKHLKDPPGVPNDQLSHLYGLIIYPDNNFEVHVDGEKKTSGNLLTSMDPPINPPKDIDDPDDPKPEDWVDEAKYDDPEASKPDDWDEDAPAQIADPKASMPSGWVEDAQNKIPDPSAKVPDDWDTEEDGEWEPPIIDNPVCKVGCGKWEPPKISNPAYKGKWYSSKIDNPAYKGVWKPRQIPNPGYFVDEEPCILPPIDSVGLDLWTMSKGIMFDNILVSTDVEKANAFADESWKKRNKIEKAQEPKRAGSSSSWWELLSENMLTIAITAIGILVTTFLWCCLRSPVPPGPPASAPVESRSREAEGTSEEVAAEDDQKEKKDDETSTKEEAASKDKPPVEGGLGDIGGDDS